MDDLVEDTQTQVTEEEPVPDYADLGSNQAAYLVQHVIAKIDSDAYKSGDDNYSSNQRLLQRRGSDPNAENYSGRDSALPPKSPFEGSKMSKKGKRKRKRLTRRRMAELPPFDVEEVLGEFETDDNGSYIILQTADGKLNDRYGRLVNRRGYLVDPEGNIVTRGNVFIFYKEEIDFDGEIPAPYCFQKTQRDAKFAIKNFTAHRRMRKRDKLAM